jgi:hypothetical protein
MLNFQISVNGTQSFVVFVRVFLHTENKIMAVTGLGQFMVKILVETLDLVVARLPAKRHKKWSLISGTCKVKL